MPTLVDGNWKPVRMAKPALRVASGPRFEVGQMVSFATTRDYTEQGAGPYWFVGTVLQVEWSDLWGEWQYQVRRGSIKRGSYCWYRERHLEREPR